MASSNLVLNIVAKDKASKTLKDVGGAVGNMSALSVVSAGAVAAFGASAIKAFTESEQAQLKLNDAFEKFPTLADTNAGELNALNREMQKKTRFDDEAYATAQAQLAQYKLTGQQLKDLIPLAADYAAKTGQDLVSASEQLGKALLGKGRALANVGIKFKDAGSIEANYAQITEGLRAQVGGFAEKEGKTAAGQVEILKNQFGELQETVGGALVPALTTIVDTITPAATKFNEMSDVSKETVTQVALLGAAAAIAGPKIANLAGWIGRTGRSAAIAKVGVGMMTAALAVGVLGVVNTVRNYDALIESLQRTREEFIKTGDAAAAEAMKKNAFDAAAELEKLTKRMAELDEANDALNRGDLSNYWENNRRQVSGLFDKVGDLWHRFRTGKSTVEDLADKIDESSEASDRYNTIINNTADYLGMTRTAVAELAGESGIDMLNGSTGDVIGQLKLFIQAQKDTGTAAGSLRETWVGAKAALSRYKDTLNDYRSRVTDVPSAQDAAARAVNDFGAALDDNGTRMSGNTKKALDNRQAARDVTTAYYDWAQKVLDTGGTLEDANKIIQAGRDKLGEMGVKAGMSKGEVFKLREQLRLIPKAKATSFKLNLDPQSMEYLDYMIGHSTPGSAANFRAKEEADAKKSKGAGSANNWGGKRASGGPVYAGQSYLVGERGPEVVTMGGSGYVTPNHALGGIVVNINGPVTSKQDAARWVMDALRTAKASGYAVGV